MAPASTATSSVACASCGSPPDVRGENFVDIALMDSSRAAGATPEKPSLPGWPATIPATRVPCPSQSVSPSVDSTKSPPASTLGSRGPGCTPVSMIATSWPSPRENCQAAGRFSIVWLGVGTPGSVPGITPETLHAPRCSIGATGPGSPLGGCAAASTTGGRPRSPPDTQMRHGSSVEHPSEQSDQVGHDGDQRNIQPGGDQTQQPAQRQRVALRRSDARVQCHHNPGQHEHG
ncbi:Uncharacterised protein [Mycobacterium tuberculosis]|nr:Uncharacterised protein [Mycobacterium tuberculosis]